MDYEAEGAAGATTPGRLGLAASAEGQALGWPPSGTYDLEGFSPVISLQVAARAARYAIRSGAINKGFGTGTSHAIGIQQERGQFNLEERVSPRRSFQLVLAFAIGAAAYACIMYVILGAQLRSPLPSPTPPLPPPGATA
jgi:hypothetical protein